MERRIEEVCAMTGRMADEAGSLRTWLAIGRGRGWLAAREAGRVCAADVIALVLQDPRWDQQVEQRAGYYATLLLPHDVDLSAIAARACERNENETDAWLAISVLGELARRGNEGALAALHAASAGPQAAYVLHTLESLAPMASITRRAAPASGFAPDVGDPERRLDEIESVLHAEARRLAADPRAVRAHARQRREMLRLLDALPPEHTLPRARAWLDAPWPLCLAAERVLADHATELDRPMIETRVAEAHVSRSYYRLCSLVDALDTIGNDASVPLLCRVHDEVAYSYARGRVLVALAAHARHPGAAERLRESLWDSDAFNRDVAANVCDASDPVAFARLTELSSDTHEEPFVRETAASTLKRAS
jgi:hypothetical protein